MDGSIRFHSQGLPSPGRLSLRSGEIHLWSVEVDRPQEAVRSLRALLAHQECVRTDRFVFEKHRRRHIVRTGVLRKLLSGYSGRSPQDIRFDYGPKGKPSLASSKGFADLHFNMSHSEELAVYAFTREGPVGVDVEFLKPMPDAESIAQRFFSVREFEELRRLPAESIVEGFFNCWTRKEAYIKATGDGLSKPLDQFDVTLVPGQPARMLLLDGDAEEAARWSYTHFRPAPQYVGALAVYGSGFKLQANRLEWEGERTQESGIRNQEESG